MAGGIAVGRVVTAEEVPVLGIGLGERILTKRGPQRVLERNVVFDGAEVWLGLEHRRGDERLLKLKASEVVYRLVAVG